MTRTRRIILLVTLAGWWAVAPLSAWAGLVSGPAARTQFEAFRDGPTADTFIDFNAYAGTGLTTQLSGLGVTFESNIGTFGQKPYGPHYVYVSTMTNRVGNIVGSPCSTGCTDDGRVGYQILFATPQRRAGLLRIWNTETLTQFYNASGQLLAEHAGSGFVGYIADGENSSTDWVARIQIDTTVDLVANPTATRQVGYSDDLFFGSAPAGTTFTPALEPGFNMIGNSLNLTLDVPALFGNQDAPTALTPDIVSVWKWNAAAGRWAFYSPTLTVSGNAAYAASQNYEVLATINAGEGYWVNSIPQRTLPAQTGTEFVWNGSTFGALPAGFNLIAAAPTLSPSQFNVNVSPTVPPQGTVPTDNFNSLWAWDAGAGTWYFYSPLLESSGGLPAVKAYADSHFFRHFEDYEKTIGLGVGFWVNRP